MKQMKYKPFLSIMTQIRQVSVHKYWWEYFILFVFLIPPMYGLCTVNSIMQGLPYVLKHHQCSFAYSECGEINKINNFKVN